MVLAALFCCLLATTAQANQEPLKASLSASHELSQDQEDAALANFAQALYELIASINNERSTTITLSDSPVPEALTNDAHPLHRAQASQVFGTFSCASAQLSQLLPPGQAQILSLFSVVTGAAATLIAMDEEAQNNRKNEELRAAQANAEYEEYKKFQQFKAAQAREQQNNQNLTRELLLEETDSNLSEQQATKKIAPQAPLNAHKLFAHAPNLTHTLMSSALKRTLFLDQQSLQKARDLLNVEETNPELCSNMKRLHEALSKVSFTLYTLEKSHPIRSMNLDNPEEFLDLQNADTLDEHKAIIAHYMASHATCDAFLETFFDLVNATAQQCVHQTLMSLKSTPQPLR